MVHFILGFPLVPCVDWSWDPVPSVNEPTAIVAEADADEDDVPIPAEEEDGRVAELLTPHFPYIAEEDDELLPSIFDNDDEPSLKDTFMLWLVFSPIWEQSFKLQVKLNNK